MVVIAVIGVRVVLVVVSVLVLRVGRARSLLLRPLEIVLVVARLVVVLLLVVAFAARFREVGARSAVAVRREAVLELWRCA
jgi:hypothetical protein